MIKTTAAVAGALLLAGCATTPAAAPEPTPTVTITEQAPVPEPEPTPEPPPALERGGAPSWFSEDQAMAYLVLKFTWEQQDAQSRATMCEGYLLEPELMFAAFEEGGQVPGMDSEVFHTLMSQECGMAGAA